MIGRFAGMLFYIKRNSLIFSFIIIILSFLFSRLPYFIWAPVPGLSYDTFQYFQNVELLNKGIYPSVAFLPPGFSLFCYIIGTISNKILTIIYVQSFITLIISLFFIYVANKYYSKLTVFLSAALSFYIMDSFKISIDTNLYTESIYSNSILLICTFLIWTVYTKNKWIWICFSVILILPPLIRSNGIYIYFLILFILLYIIYNKYPKRYYLYLLIPVFSLNILWGLYSYKIDGTFSIANIKRVKYKINSSQYYRLGDKVPRDEKISLSDYFKDKSILLGKYINNISTSKPQFYYSIIPVRYERLYIQDNIHKPDLMIDIKTREWILLEESIRKLVYKEYLYKNDPYKSIISDFNVKNKFNNLWLLLYHVYYKIHNLFFWNIIWVLFYFIMFVYSSILMIKNKFINKEIFIINTLCLVHFLAILVITFGHGRFVPRYSHVTEFVYYLVPVFSILIFKSKINFPELKTIIIKNNY